MPGCVKREKEGPCGREMQPCTVDNVKKGGGRNKGEEALALG